MPTQEDMITELGEVTELAVDDMAKTYDITPIKQIADEANALGLPMIEMLAFIRNKVRDLLLDNAVPMSADLRTYVFTK